MADRKTETASHDELLTLKPSTPENITLAGGGPSEQGCEEFSQRAYGAIERLQQREGEFAKLLKITERVNRGVMLEEVLDSLHDEMREVIPYHRIGLALIEHRRGMVVARWAKSDRPTVLTPGYEAPLEGSSLNEIVETGHPRIINDLEAYLHNKPHSDSTRRIVSEGMRSSLTCPLIIQGKPVGFVFFSSADAEAYSDAHVAFFQQVAGQLATIIEKGRLYNQLAGQKALIERQQLALIRDLELAQQVQRSLIPSEQLEIEGLEIAFEYEPALRVSGDILDIIPLDGNKVVFFVGDAMGHGVQAALVMAITKAALLSAVQADPRPKNILASINRVVARLFTDRFVTAACCVLDLDVPHAELSLAGHAGPLCFRAKTAEVLQTGSAGGMPLGVLQDPEFGTATIPLDPGDALIFSTDGITEAADPGGDQYGLERLKSQVRLHGGSSAGELCRKICRNVEDHCKHLVHDDDLTLLIVKLEEFVPDFAI